MANDRKGYLLVFIAGITWGFIGPLMMVMRDAGASSELTSFLRMLFAFIIILPIAIVKCGWQALRVDVKTPIACALLGIICSGIYNVFYVYAVTVSGVATAAVLLNVAPIFGLLFSALLFKERATWMKVLAIVLDVAGCILVVTNGELNALSFSVFGVLCGIGAGVTYSLTAIISRVAASKANPFVMSVYSYLFATLFLVVYAQPWTYIDVLNVQILGAGFVLALVPTALGYVIYYKGVTLIRENSKVPVVASIETVVACVFGFAVYHESLGLATILGIVMVLISIALMSYRRKMRG